MNQKTQGEEAKRAIAELDDRIEELVASIDENDPASHAAVYAEIAKIHETIFAMKAKLRSETPLS